MKIFLSEHPSSSQVPTPPGVGPPVANPNVTSISLLVGQTYNLNNLFTSPSGEVLSFLADPTAPLGDLADLNAVLPTHELLTADFAGSSFVRFIADDGLTPATTALASFITSQVMPSFAGTPMKFGQKVAPFVYQRIERICYGIGGEAAYGPRSSSVLGGTPVLWKFEGSTRTLSVAQSYPLTSGVFQPSFPDGVGLAYRQNPTPDYIAMIPGMTVMPGSTYGAWVGSSVPISSRVMLWNTSTNVWTSGGAAAITTFPAPMFSAAFRDSINNDHFYCVRLVGGAMALVDYNMDSGAITQSAISTAGFTSTDVLTNQFWSGYRNCVMCYDWANGRILQVNPDNLTCTTTINVPALAASSDPFTMSYDPVEDRMLLFYSAGVYAAELWSNTTTFVGSLPNSEAGLYTSWWDPSVRKHYATGAAGGTPNIYEYETPPTVDAAITQGLWNDSGLGVTGSFFCKLNLWTWLNQDGRGDYAGVNGVMYPGSDTPYSTLSFSAQGLITISATDILNYWLAHVNSGCVLRGSGTYRFKQRRDTDPTVRPYLSVTTTTGVVRCECAQSTWLGTGSNDETSQTSTGYLTVDGISTVLKFDLSPLAGKAVVSATMNLTAYSGSGSGTLQIWYLVAPPIVEAGSVGATLTDASISDAYLFDEGIVNNANVVTASDFSAGYSTRMGGNGFTIAETVADPNLGDLVGGKIRFRAYEASAASQTTNFSSFKSLTDQEEGWFRIAVTFQSNWGSAVFSSGIGGGKMGFSWDYRMGSTCGNGGAGSTGLAEYTTEHGFTVNTTTGVITSTSTAPLVDGVDKCKFIRFTPPTGLTEGQEYFVRNPVNTSGDTWTFQVSLTAAGTIIVPSTQRSGTNAVVFSPYTGFQYCGGSARMNYQGAGPEDGYKHFITPYLYIYRAGVSGFGDAIVFGDATNGYFVFKKGVTYQIEGYIKMNSVVGPFDSLGDGTGVADGVLKYWVNGRQMYSNTGLIYRLNAGEKINGYWHDWTHGGTQDTQAEHDAIINAFVLARSRVGLVRTV